VVLEPGEGPGAEAGEVEVVHGETQGVEGMGCAWLKGMNVVVAFQAMLYVAGAALQRKSVTPLG
jgi:hypothetical protein